MSRIDLGNVKGPKGDTGAKGDRGTSFRHVRAWAPSTPYASNLTYVDIVTYNGSAYSCKQDHTSGASFEADAAKWELLSSKGDKGATGATGSQGPKGDTGAKGDKGDSPTFEIDANGHLIAIYP